MAERTPQDDTTEGGEEFAAYADEARDWANVTLPTALEGWPDDTTAPARCDGSKRCGYHHAVVGVFRCCCGQPWINKSCASGAKAGEPAPDDTTAPETADLNVASNVQVDARKPETPVTAEVMERRIAEVLTRDRSSGLCPLDGPCTSCDCFDPLHEYDRANAKAVMAEVVAPVLERFRKAVEDAPAVVAWTGACVECGEPFERRDSITWRLRWSPQGPIHEECR